MAGRRMREVIRRARLVAAEIELLAPAVRRGGSRPDNCEYPWEDRLGNLHGPLDWHFAPSRLLHEPSGRTILKLIQAAIRESCS